MKLNKLFLAVAGTLVAGQVYAAPVTQADVVAARGATPATLKETWISGASAPTFNIFDGFVRGCDAGSLSIFSAGSTVSTPGATGDYNAYACTRSGVVTVLYHTVAGGSFNAYAPHISSTSPAPDGSVLPAKLQRVRDVGTASCTATTYSPSPAITSIPSGTPFYRSCNRGFAGTSGSTTEYKTATTSPFAVSSTAYSALNDSAPSLPHGGFSDVEAKLWNYDVSTKGTESSTGVQQAFGVVVTTNLYRQLQVSQGIYATTAAAISGDSLFAIDKAPNITSAQYASIVQDQGGYQTDWSGLLGSAFAGQKINLVKRVGTSGTQAASNAFFLGNPCSSGLPQGQIFPATTSVNALVVSAQSGTSGVKSKLVDINNHATDYFGLGVVSLENSPAAEYRFVKIDGVHPENGDLKARATMVNGSYKFVMEMNTFVANTADASSQTLINSIATKLRDPVLEADLGRGLALVPGGVSLFDPTNSTITSKGTKFGNNCAPMQLFY